jgi:hypothetical protein
MRVDFESMFRESSDKECKCWVVKKGDIDSVLKNIKREIIEIINSKAIIESKVRTIPFMTII